MNSSLFRRHSAGLAGRSLTSNEKPPSIRTTPPQTSSRLAQFSRRAADYLQRTADHLRERDEGTLRVRVAGFARRHPVAVLAGGIVTGLVVASLFSRRRARDVREAPSPYRARKVRPRTAAETVVRDDTERIREAGPVPRGRAGEL